MTEACTPGVERYEELRVMPAQEGVHQHNRPLGGTAYVWQRRGRKHTSRWIGFAQLVVHSENGKKIRQSLPSSSYTHTHTRHMEQRSCIKTQKLYEKISTLKKKSYWDYPGGSGIRNLPANAGDAGSVPELGEDLTCRRATKPVSHKLLSLRSRAWELQILTPCATPRHTACQT